VTAPRVSSRTRSDLLLTTELRGDSLVATLAGDGDATSMDTLSAFLKNVDQEATENSVKSVVLDFQELEFMNTSCFRMLVSWIAGVGRAGRGQYHVTFRGNPSLCWQRRGLDALRSLAVQVARTSVKPPSSAP